ncbi:hypothetical protein Trydic_g16774 [Trypoxylus dichotomus]
MATESRGNDLELIWLSPTLPENVEYLLGGEDENNGDNSDQLELCKCQEDDDDYASCPRSRTTSSFYACV